MVYTTLCWGFFSLTISGVTVDSMIEIFDIIMSPTLIPCSFISSLFRSLPVLFLQVLGLNKVSGVIDSSLVLSLHFLPGKPEPLQWPILFWRRLRLL